MVSFEQSERQYDSLDWDHVRAKYLNVTGINIKVAQSDLPVYSPRTRQTESEKVSFRDEKWMNCWFLIDFVCCSPLLNTHDLFLQFDKEIRYAFNFKSIRQNYVRAFR